MTDITANRAFLLKLASIIVATGTAIVTTVLVARAFGPLPISVSSTVSSQQNLFTAEGRSEITTIPDQATVTLGIDIGRPTVAQAQNDANEVMNSISEGLKELGIEDEDIATQNYNIYPDYNFEPGQRQISGYRVNANLVVTVDEFENLNSAIDIATSLGANQVGGINFTLSKDREDELRKQAREEAIANAKESAQELARLSGVRLGKVINVEESKGTPMYPQPFAARDVAVLSVEPESAPTNIEPGSSTYTYTVFLSYETL